MPDSSGITKRASNGLKGLKCFRDRTLRNCAHVFLSSIEWLVSVVESQCHKRVLRLLSKSTTTQQDKILTKIEEMVRDRSAPDISREMAVGAVPPVCKTSRK